MTDKTLAERLKEGRGEPIWFEGDVIKRVEKQFGKLSNRDLQLMGFGWTLHSHKSERECREFAEELRGERQKALDKDIMGVACFDCGSLEEPDIEEIADRIWKKEAGKG